MTADASLLGLSEGGQMDDAGSDVSSSSLLGRCDLKDCSGIYDAERERLYKEDPALRDKPAICAVLENYLRCVKRVPGCAADLGYHTIRKLIRSDLHNNACPNGRDKTVEKGEKAGDKADATNRGGSTTRDSRGRRPPKAPPAMCRYMDKPVFRHCGLFGDPHLRTFNGDFQTCKVKGAWPLVNNDYLTVQVTNDPVEGSTVATATSKLTVIVKGNSECTSRKFATYQAQWDSLPGSFDDGRVHVGPYHSLELVEVSPGEHVEIHVRYINTVVVIRRIGRYLTFSIQMPESLINSTGGLVGGGVGIKPAASTSSAAAASLQDVQLCLRGCPESELINYQEYLALRRDITPGYSSPVPSSSGVHVDVQTNQTERLTRAEAEAICREAAVVGFYFDFCVFDLLATGDRNFTLSAVAALHDVLRLDPSVAASMENRTSLTQYDEQYARGGAASRHVTSLGAAWWWRTYVTGVTALVFGGGVAGRSMPRDVVLSLLLVLTLILHVSSPR